MNFDFSEEQNILKSSARKFLEKECPSALVRALEEDEKGYSPDLWRRMASMGWLGAVFPEEFGGTAGNIVDLCLLQEEMGRVLLPSPFLPTVVLAGRTILHAGNKDQKHEFLTGITRGDLILTLAILEAEGRPIPSQIRLNATYEKGDYILNGVKYFVPYAHVADFIVCVARTETGMKDQEGITLFMMNAKSPGIKIESLKTITGEKLCQIRFDGVRIPESGILGEPNHGWTILHEVLSVAAIAECGWMIGSARWVLERVVEYAKERIQFGVPIGSFQAIQHKCADMLVDVDSASFITYYAAWLASENDPSKTLVASEAKAWCGDMNIRVAQEGIQIMGGIGFTLEHDMQLYYRRARASETVFGDGHYHREKAAALLGL